MFIKFITHFRLEGGYVGVKVSLTNTKMLTRAVLRFMTLLLLSAVLVSANQGKKPFGLGIELL